MLRKQPMSAIEWRTAGNPMRLWTLHPQYLDARGLVALWREGLLALKVLAGKTRGYRHHPQLLRFRACPDPLAAITIYLRYVYAEAARRGYRFDAAKLPDLQATLVINETSGQLLYEWEHLKHKLRARSPGVYQEIQDIPIPQPHPLFSIIDGDVQAWEKRSNTSGLFPRRNLL